MTYENIVPARFLDRPNRFVAHAVLEDGRTVTVHVKNTGRCRELLVPDAGLLLQHRPDPGRRTEWDLISVYKGKLLINMDAAAPNKVFAEWLCAGGIPGAEEIRPERTRGDSRFDFGFTLGGTPCLAEVKGVTLETDGIARFPDAPSPRAVKHLRGLKRAVEEGFFAWAVFVVQMEGMRRVEPNWATHREFGLALREAAAAGVRVLALECRATENSLAITGEIPVSLAPPEL